MATIEDRGNPQDLSKKIRYFRKTARYNGKKYEATGKTELEAMTKLAEKLAAVKRGEEAIDGSMTVDSWYRQWKALYKEPKGLTAKSLGMYDEKYNGYIKPRIGRLKLKDVKDVHLQIILNEQAGKSASHVKKIRLVMQEMFKRARQSRLIAYDPAELLELPAFIQKKRRSITEEEREAILAVAEYHRSGLWILTLLYTGMRPGETAALTWADVDFKKNEIHIHSAKESGSCLLESILIVYEKPKKVKPVRKNRRRMQLFHMVPTSVCTLCPLLEKRAAFSPFCVSLMLCRRIFFYLYSTFFKGLVNASKRFFKKKRNFVNLYSRQQKKML